ncbi:hypothetical protein Bbelb_192710 [Branchiostoma belcheri]|nr:hypothetical protein Bbelb_192710 [Branchiostoma belcheri]
MNYYNIETLLKMRSTNPMKTFLEDAWKFKNLSEAYFPHRNLIYDPTRNFMSFDLGYPAEAAEDMERARRYIKELEADFTLIMLLDYQDESLVLLKRLMCWDLQDGPDFFEELSIFKDMSKHVHAYCSTGHKPGKNLTIEASKGGSLKASSNTAKKISGLSTVPCGTRQ